MNEINLSTDRNDTQKEQETPTVRIGSTVPQQDESNELDGAVNSTNTNNPHQTMVIGLRDNTEAPNEDSQIEVIGQEMAEESSPIAQYSTASQETIDQFKRQSYRKLIIISITSLVVAGFLLVMVYNFFF